MSSAKPIYDVFLRGDSGRLQVWPNAKVLTWLGTDEAGNTVSATLKIWSDGRIQVDVTPAGTD